MKNLRILNMLYVFKFDNIVKYDISEFIYIHQIVATLYTDCRDSRLTRLEFVRSRLPHF